jgi:hypothetical protein
MIIITYYFITKTYISQILNNLLSPTLILVYNVFMSSSIRPATCKHCFGGYTYNYYGTKFEKKCRCVYCQGTNVDPYWLAKDCDECGMEIYLRPERDIPQYCGTCQAKINRENVNNSFRRLSTFRAS